MKETNQRHQTALAKLLSHEDITIQHGNFSTAFFDVENRVLGLPIWKDKGKDVYDLLVGHEVGHALYTPSWKPETFPCPAVYVNIVEDIRIERLIKMTYPGLIAAFRRGYDVLLKDNFFGTKGKDVDAFGIADRINLKAKLDILLPVNFTPDEQAILKTVFSVETWEDTLQAAKALYDFTKEQQAKEHQQKQKKQDASKQKSQPKADAEDDSSDDDNSSGDSEQEIEVTPGSTPSDEKDEDPKDEQKKSSKGSSSEKSEDKDEQDEEGSSDIEQSSSADGEKDEQAAPIKDAAKTSEPAPALPDPEVLTEKIFAEAAKNLIDKSHAARSLSYVSDPTSKECFERVVPFKELFTNRDNTKSYRDWIKNNPGADAKFNEFMTATKKQVAVLVKEFELRKAAFQYSRATTSKTGILDVNRLHSYKTNDDIFKSISKLADAKNHGMVLIVDYSSSMSGVLPHILKHLINLTTFCKAVQIPFEVYSFTGGVSYRRQDSSTLEGRVDISNTLMCQLLSSDMNKAEYNRGIKDLFRRSTGYYAFGECEALGGTPLCEAAIIAHKLIKDFRAKHPVQKMTTMILTDGEGQGMAITRNSKYDANRLDSTWGDNMAEFNLNGRRFRTSLYATPCLKALIKNLRITTGTKVLGFFIPNSPQHAKKNAEYACTERDREINPKQESWSDGLGADYRQDKSLCIKGGFGYDEYFIVASGDGLDVKDDNLDIKGQMTRSEMKDAFTNFALSKKNNRVFVNKFAEAIS